MKRQHPIAILRYTSKNFWLLLIPVIRGLRFLKYDFHGWISGVYVDVIILLIIITAAVFRWYNVKYYINQNGIKIKNGVFIKRNSFIASGSISIIKIEEYLHLKPFKAVIIYLNTDIKSSWIRRKKTDIKLVVTLKEQQQILNKMTTSKSDVTCGYKPSRKKIMLYAMLFSSTVSGLIYFSTLVINGGTLVVDEIESRFIIAVNNITTIAEKVIGKVSPFSVAAAVVIIAGWLISFFKICVRYINFKVERMKKTLIIENRFFSYRRYFIDVEKINCIDLKQNFLMKICKVVSVNISCAGSRRNGVPAVIPVSRIKEATHIMKILLPEVPVKKIEIHPRKNCLVRFVALPVLFIYGVIAAAVTLTMIFPDWYRVIFFTALMAEIFLVNLYFSGLIEFYVCGIGFHEKYLTMKYRKFIQFHYIIIPYNKVISIKISQNIFQKRKNVCDVIIFEKNNNGSHRVKNINLCDLSKSENRYCMK